MEELKESLQEEQSKYRNEELINNFLNFNDITEEIENKYEDTEQIFETKENTSITFESIELLENLYLSIVNNYDDIEILKNFTQIYFLYSQNQDVIFFAFWLPYIKSKENLVSQILKRTKVFCYKTQIELTDPSTYSHSLLNTFAFQLALSNKFNDNFVNFILDQGKIKIPMEWILERIIMEKLETVERALKGGNDCTITSNTLINTISECLESNENFKGIIKSRIKKEIPSFFSKSSKMNYFPNNPQSLNINASSEINIKGKEITNFLIKRIGNLSITKILVFASLINFYYKEIIDHNKNENVEKFDIENLLKSICLFDRKEKKFSIQILQGLYLIKYKNIARELLEANLLSIDVKVLQTSIEFKDLKFTLQFYQLYKDLIFYENECFHNLLIENIYNDYDNVEIYLYLLKNFIDLNFVKFNSVKFFLKITEDLLQANGKENDLYSNFYNPLKIFILFAEVLQMLKFKFTLLDYSISRLIDKCILYSENILTLVEEYKIFREIILEKDLSNRTILDIISDNNFLSLLKFKLVEKIVDDLWKGPYSTEGSFLETSYNYKSLISNPISKDYDGYTKMRGSLTKYKEEDYKTNFTSFKVWRENVYIKYYAEITITVVLLILYISLGLVIVGKYQAAINQDFLQIEKLGKEVNYFLYGESENNNNYIPPIPIYNSQNLTYSINSSLINNPDYFNLIKSCDTASLKNATIIEILNEAHHSYFNTFNDKIYFTFYWSYFLIYTFHFVYLIPFSYIVRFIFQFKFRKPEFGLTIFSDICLVSWMIFVRYFMNKTHLLIMNNIQKSLTDDIVHCFEFLPYFKNHFDLITNDPQWKDLFSISIVCSCLWLRLVLILRGTKNIGTIIVIFFLALNGIKYYLILFISVTFAYGCLAVLNFYNVDGMYFKNILMSFYYYAIASVGSEPLYNDFYKENTQNQIQPQSYVVWFGGLVIFVVLVFNSIIMFNIIIAHLTNIFEKYSANSKQLFVQKKIELRRKFYTEDKRFDSLLVSLYPFEVLLLPSILFLFSKSEKFTNAINKLNLWIHFSLFAFFYSFAYIIFTAVLIPISYVKIVISKFLQIFISDEQNYFAIYKIFSFICYIIFGLILHLFHFFIDFMIFLKEMKKDKIVLNSDKENSGKFKIRLRVLKLIISISLYFEENSRSNSNKYTIHIEKFLEIFLLALEKEDLLISEDIIGLFKKYNQEKDNPIAINQEFNIYINKYINRMALSGVDYKDLCDFLSNFWDDKNVIDLTIMKTVINIYWSYYKIKKFYLKVSDKNYEFEIELNPDKISIIKKAEIKSKNSIMLQESYQSNEDTSQINNKTYTPLKNQDSTVNCQIKLNPSIDLSLLKKSTDYFIDSTKILKRNNSYLNVGNITKATTKTQFPESINTSISLLLQSEMKRKLTKIKLQRDSKDNCIIPIIPRSIIFIFLTSLKEGQLDAVKKLSENLLKNQKYLQEITNKYEVGAGLCGLKHNFEVKNKSLNKNNNLPSINSNSGENIRNINKVQTVPTKCNKNLKEIKLSQIEENTIMEEISPKSRKYKNDCVKKNVFVNTTKIDFLRGYLKKIKREGPRMKSITNIKLHLPSVTASPISDKKINSSSSDSSNSSRTSLLDFNETQNENPNQNANQTQFKQIINERVLTSVEIIKMEEKLEQVEQRIARLESNIADILSCVKFLINDKLNKA